MSTQLLYFNNVQIGDHLLRMVPLDQLLTPPVSRVGLFQDYSESVCESRNVLRRIRFDIALSRASMRLLFSAIGDIRGYLGQTYNLVVKDGGVTKLSASDWIMEEVGVPEIPEGFGGRFCRSMEVYFIGNSIPFVINS